MSALSASLKQQLLALKYEELTVNKISNLFGTTTKKGSFEVQPPKFDPRATFTLKAGEYINKEDIDTTVGSFLFNKLMIEGLIDQLVPNGYVNDVITKKTFGKIVDLVADGLRAGKIQIDPTAAEFLRRWENWGLSLVSVFSPSYTMGMVKPNPKLVEATQKAVANAKLDTVEDMVKLEDELVEVAKKTTEGDPGRTMFDSGSRGSFSNDYKNMAVFVGPVQSPVTGKYDFMTSNYMTGLKKEDLVPAGNIIVNAEYPKAIGTARGGYITKQFYAVFQMLMVDKPGTDCHTTKGLRVKLSPDNVRHFVGQYMMTNKGPVELTAENASKAYGKNVLIRSPMFCLNKKTCSICAGRMPEQFGIDAVGLLSVNLSNNLMNKNLKLRHSLKMELDKIDIDKLLI